MVQHYIIQSEQGDEYKLRLTSENTWMLPEDLCQLMKTKDIEVVDIELERSKGTNVTSSKVLSLIEGCIADYMLNHRNVLFCFFCDFIHTVPTRKNIPVQEYRSRLFSAMFNSYVTQHHLEGFCNHVVKIEGVAETFYFHVIYRDEHEAYARMISEVNQKDFSKPKE